MAKGRKPTPEIERIQNKYKKGDSNECWIWHGAKCPDGYGQFWWYKEKRLVKGHRAMWRLYKGEIPKGLCALHKCDNPSCVNPDHLFLGTKADNARDRDQKNRTHRKLDDAQLKEMNELRSCGWKLRELAAQFNVTIAAISYALKRTKGTNYA